MNILDNYFSPWAQKTENREPNRKYQEPNWKYRNQIFLVPCSVLIFQEPNLPR